MHLLRVISYQRYIYLSPIEGFLNSYKTIYNFPYQPNYIIRLIDVNTLRLFEENSWYQKQGMTYFSVRSSSKHSIFYHGSKDLIRFWMTEINRSIQFQTWV